MITLDVLESNEGNCYDLFKLEIVSAITFNLQTPNNNIMYPSRSKERELQYRIHIHIERERVVSATMRYFLLQREDTVFGKTQIGHI